MSLIRINSTSQRICCLVLLTLLCGCQQEQAQQVVPVPNAEWGGLTVHLKGAPLEKAKWAVVLMHGYGAPGDDLVGLEAQIPVDDDVAFVYPEAPLAIGFGSRAWNTPGGSGFGESRKQVIDLLTDIVKKSPGCGIIIGGFSQGGTMSSNLIAEAKACNIKGVVLYSPASNLDYVPEKSTTQPMVFLSHGLSDAVLAFSGSEELKKRLEDAGCDVTFFSFSGGHELSREILAETSKFIKKVRSDDSKGVRS